MKFLRICVSTKIVECCPYLFCLYEVLVLRYLVSGRVRGQELV